MFFLFPGQGAQYPGMALDFLNEHAGEEARRLFSLASEITGIDMLKLLRDSGPEELKRTDLSQPAITLANLAAASSLAGRGIEASGCAGFSLGEYAALKIAGIIGEEDCFSLVNQRGKAMQAALDRMAGGAGMAAVTGLAPEKVEALITEWKNNGLDDLYTANINSHRQVVVSGNDAALEEAGKRFKESGARRVLRLQVAGPFHSPFMKEAADEFAHALEKVTFKDPTIPVFSNVTGKQIQSGEEAKNLALRHITEGVRWADEEEAIAMFGPELLLETGPGNVLMGLWKDTGSSVPCLPAGTVEAINELVPVHKAGHFTGGD